MSVFRSLSRVLSQQQLNNKANNYVLNLKNSIQNPALYYLHSSTPPQDLYALSLVTYHLVRKHELGQNLVQQIEGQSKGDALTSIQQRFVAETAESQKVVNEHVKELRKLLKVDVGSLPIHNAIQALYAFEATNNSDIPLYEATLFPIIKEKLHYASLNNLIELANILSNAKYFEDKSLWEGLLQQLDAKLNTPRPQYVNYSGWTLDTYEAASDKSKAEGQISESEQHFNDLKGGSESIADLKHQIRVYADWFISAFVYRFLFGEGRVTQTLDNFQEKTDRERIRRSLESAQNAGFNVDSVTLRLK